LKPQDIRLGIWRFVVVRYIIPDGLKHSIFFLVLLIGPLRFGVLGCGFERCVSDF
jgi:hypothetical protein